MMPAVQALWLRFLDSASHQIVEQALTILANLTHRGAQDANAETNDGAGLLTQIPRALLAAELRDKDIVLAMLRIWPLACFSASHQHRHVLMPGPPTG